MAALCCVTWDWLRVTTNPARDPPTTKPPNSDDAAIGTPVAYHLVAGRPPNVGIPLPVRAQARDVPERVSSALDAALALDPTERPDISSLGATLRAARDDLS
jgi:hypothetical protein